MKSSIIKLLTLTIAGLGMTLASYGDVYFNVTHDTGTAVEVYTIGDSDDVGTWNAYPTAPASGLGVEYADGDNYQVYAYVDSTYAVGYWYYIGYFEDGGDAWLSID